MVAFYASARGLQIGPGVEVITLASVAANLVAIVGGILVFRDSIGSGTLEIAARFFAFCLVIVGAALVPARSGRRTPLVDSPRATNGGTGTLEYPNGTPLGPGGLGFWARVEAAASSLARARAPRKRSCAVPASRCRRAGDPYWWGEARLPAPGRAGNARWHTSRPPRAPRGAGSRSSSPSRRLANVGAPGDAQLFPGSDRAVGQVGVVQAGRCGCPQASGRPFTLTMAGYRRQKANVAVGDGDAQISIPSKAYTAGGGRDRLKRPETADRTG